MRCRASYRSAGIGCRRCAGRHAAAATAAVRCAGATPWQQLRSLPCSGYACREPILLKPANLMRHARTSEAVGPQAQASLPGCGGGVSAALGCGSSEMRDQGALLSAAFHAWDTASACRTWHQFGRYQQVAITCVQHHLRVETFDKQRKAAGDPAGANCSSGVTHWCSVRWFRLAALCQSLVHYHQITSEGTWFVILCCGGCAHRDLAMGCSGTSAL